MHKMHCNMQCPRAIGHPSQTKSLAVQQNVSIFKYEQLSRNSSSVFIRVLLQHVEAIICSKSMTCIWRAKILVPSNRASSKDVPLAICVS
jgi:hypothetical protein